MDRETPKDEANEVDKLDRGRRNGARGSRGGRGAGRDGGKLLFMHPKHPNVEQNLLISLLFRR